MINQAQIRTQTLSTQDVVEIVKIYVDLKEIDGIYRAYCPLCHKDDLSFYIDPQDGRWHCARCGQEGDV